MWTTSSGKTCAYQVSAPRPVIRKPVGERRRAPLAVDREQHASESGIASAKSSMPVETNQLWIIGHMNRLATSMRLRLPVSASTNRGNTKAFAPSTSSAKRRAASVEAGDLPDDDEPHEERGVRLEEPVEDELRVALRVLDDHHRREVVREVLVRRDVGERERPRAEHEQHARGDEGELAVGEPVEAASRPRRGMFRS